MNAVTNFDLRSYITWLKPSAAPAAFSNPEAALMMHAAPAEQLHHPAETAAQMLQRGNPFLLDHGAAPPGGGGGGQEASMSSMVSPGCAGGMRKRGASTALSLLLKSSMFRQLVEKNSDAEEGVKDREAAAAAAAHPGPGDAYEYHNFFQGEAPPDMCDLFSSGGGGHARNAGFHGEIAACYDDGDEGLDGWNGFGNMSSLQ